MKILKILKDYHKEILTTIVLFILIGFGFYLTLKEAPVLVNISDRISYFGFCATIYSLMLLTIQSANSRDLDRRRAASAALMTIQEKLDPYMYKIHTTFGYYTRKESNTIRIKEIHDEILKKENGKFIKDDITNLYELEEDKKDVYKAIWNALGIYEYIAAQVHQKIWDKELVAEMFKGNIIKIASVFEPYIEHVNENMYPERNSEVWINIRNLGAEFKKKYRKKPKANKRKN